MFDFRELAAYYDDFYATDRGKLIDKIEKNLVGEFLEKIPSGKTLEIGCGTGHWTEFFAEFENDIIGIDISREMIEMAERKNIPNTVCLQHDVMSMPFKDNFFENIFSVTAMEFVEDLDKAFSEIKRVLKHYGFLLIAVLNEESDYMKRRLEDPVFSKANLFTVEKLKKYLKIFGKPVIKGCIFSKNNEIIDEKLNENEKNNLKNAAFLVGMVRYESFLTEKNKK